MRHGLPRPARSLDADLWALLPEAEGMSALAMRAAC
jgi:hypothetical protein